MEIITESLTFCDEKRRLNANILLPLFGSMMEKEVKLISL